MVTIYNKKWVEVGYYEDNEFFDLDDNLLGYAEIIRPEHYGIFAVDDVQLGFYIWRYRMIYSYDGVPHSVLREEEIIRVNPDNPDEEYTIGFVEGDEEELLSAAALWAFSGILFLKAGLE